MSGVISFRTSKGERDRMRAEMRELGLDTLGALCRYRFGFPAGEGGTETLKEHELVAEMPVDLATAKVLAMLVDRIDELQRRLSRITRHLGIPDMRDSTAPLSERAQAAIPEQFRR